MKIIPTGCEHVMMGMPLEDGCLQEVNPALQSIDYCPHVCHGRICRGHVGMGDGEWGILDGGWQGTSLGVLLQIVRFVGG